ncbi:MAG: FAD-dependent oxidoreductase [Blastomonas sp.]
MAGSDTEQSNTGRGAGAPSPFAVSAPWLHVSLRIWLKVYGVALAAIRPLFDVLMRLLIGLYLLRSGLVKLADWDNAVALASFEYPVPWISPANAAALGIAIETVGAVLLILGLGTRFAALAVFGLILTAQLYYIPVDINLFILALTGWLVLYGADAISLDRMLSGLGGSALPLALPASRAFGWMRDRLAPIWSLAARIWLAATLAVSADLAPHWANALIFPSGTFAPLPVMLAIVAIFLVLLGAALPLLSAILVLSLAGAQILGFHPDLSAFAMLFAAMFLIRGSGPLGIDRACMRWAENHILFDRHPDDVPRHWPHVVVVGGGFGGLACVGDLRKLPVRVTLIDQRNYHLFQPLLYQIATAGLSPADVAIPIRSLYRGDGNVRVMLGRVDGVDCDSRTVRFGDNSIDYDYLVLATGATHSYFGRDEWAPHAPGLKRIEDAVAVRAEVLGAFEKAEASADPDRVKRLLTFVIVGAGPTGVELAGAIAELARDGLKQEFRAIDPASARILLVQSADRILPQFPEALSARATRSLESLGVEVITGARVTEIGATEVKIGERVIETETVLWAAGVVASDAGRWAGGDTDRAGRAIVDEHLRIAGQSNVFAIGDTAASKGWNGEAVPGLAPAAKQAGKYVAGLIRAELQERDQSAPFAYRHQGSLATIGRKSAVADFGWMKLSGAAAWWLWGIVHVGFLLGMRNRAAVVLNWVWNYFTLRSGIRLITDQGRSD